MKIAIIGGGWVGCHLAMKLMDYHDITIFEKEFELFTETSFKNQNRLHYGYHYPRNYKTRELCKNTHEKFISDYSFLIKDVPKNLYCIPTKKSLIDFKTYTNIFKDYNFEFSENPLKNIEGCINTNEKFIDHKIAKKWFNNKLKDLTVQKKVTKQNIKKISKNYDLVINSTNNLLKLYDTDSFYELTISLIYKKLNNTLFDSITIMDGKFFSIYPYGDDLFTLTDVEYTPIKKFKSPKKIESYKSKITKSKIESIKNKMEKKVLEYYDDFNNHFKYHDFFLSVKCKTVSGSDERYPIINKNGNIIDCYTGKIQGIYIITDYVNRVIYENINR